LGIGLNQKFFFKKLHKITTAPFESEKLKYILFV
jgi:hypothetical protein